MTQSVASLDAIYLEPCSFSHLHPEKKHIHIPLITLTFITPIQKMTKIFLPICGNIRYMCECLKCFRKLNLGKHSKYVSNALQTNTYVIINTKMIAHIKDKVQHLV